MHLCQIELKLETKFVTQVERNVEQVLNSVYLNDAFDFSSIQCVLQCNLSAETLSAYFVL